MKTPKIIFTYSWIYNQQCKEWTKFLERKGVKYPSARKILNRIKIVKPLWKKQEKKILEELSKVSGLKRKKNEIPCYVVGRMIPFSDPLTLPIYNKHPDYFIDVLVHEVIHQLFIQDGNRMRAKKAWAYIHRKFKNESLITRIHIPLHALHSYIYLKFFDEDRLGMEISSSKFSPDYKRSWELVQEIGYKKIIDEFTKRIQ